MLEACPDRRAGGHTMQYLYVFGTKVLTMHNENQHVSVAGL
jgi:hypothetical protein